MHPVASAPRAPFGRAQAQPRSRTRSFMAAILVGASFATTSLPVPAFAKGPASYIQAVQRISFDVGRGRTVARCISEFQHFKGPSSNPENNRTKIIPINIKCMFPNCLSTKSRLSLTFWTQAIHGKN